MTLDTFLECLTCEIRDPEEGMATLSQLLSLLTTLVLVRDSKASVLDLAVGNHDMRIHQSPTILASAREKGTTGAVVWKITPRFASWISNPQCPLFTHQVLNRSSAILELGCGISGVIAMTLAPLVHAYTLTDQEYVMKLLHQNLQENQPDSTASTNKRPAAKSRSSGKARGRLSTAASADLSSNIIFRPLDWETDVVTSSLCGHRSNRFDAVIACDCVYNEALIEPLVQTCADVCRLREDQQGAPTLCIVAQQLRSDEVFKIWLQSFQQHFCVWRVPDPLLTPDLASGSGFAIHVGILRKT